jgi:drug/metabolite transporter (DMT)-like permease
MASVLMVVTAGALWGTIGLFSRALNDAGLDSFQVTEARCMITAIGLLLILGVWKRDLLKISLKDSWMFVGTGICSIIVFNILYFQTAQLVSLSMTAVLLYTAPCFVLIFSVFIFHEKLTAQKLAALVFAFVGCIFTAGIIGGSDDFNMMGFVMGIGSGISYSLYSIFGKFALKKYHALTVTFYTFLFAGVALLPFCAPWHIIEVAARVDEGLWYMLGLGLLITLIPYFLYTQGLRGLDAGVASVIAFIEPMVATIAGFIVYNEEVTFFSLLGIVMILFSVILLNLDRGRLRVILRERHREKQNEDV